MKNLTRRRALTPFLIFFPLFWLARIYYVYDNWHQPGFSPWDRNILLFPIFDLSALAYSLLPLAFFISLSSLPYLQRFRPGIVKAVFTATCLFWVVFSVSELFFIQELNSRFNFIAVDYLVYTNEVVKNIWQSYPIVWILLGIGAVIVPFTLWWFRPFFGYVLSDSYRGPKFSVGVLFLALLALAFVNENKILSSRDSVGAEIAKNGLHTLFFAYRHNEIDYQRFYFAFDGAKATSLVREDLARLEAGQAVRAKENSILRNISFAEKPRKLNVVIVLMESMSASFMGVYGMNPKNLTPELDRLAREGVWFSDLYASGTRTVRGIEAVMLSIPPTPGQSIVRREGGTGIFNLGSVLHDNGYHLDFVYGGYAPFDNMGPFFAGNGFAVNDQTTFDKKEVEFSNAWGVSDEDLFKQAIKNADTEAANHRPFFQFILNTSNHRPYTYPDGKIDLPPKVSGRDGAVKYSDYAIGKYMKEAAAKSWFRDTLFVFVADHNASVAGGTAILPSDYLIPTIFYAPAHLKAEKKTGLASQIDIAPTILSVLRLPYQSRFWGTSLLERRPGRAFLGTYQKVGLFDGQNLAVLSPKRYIELYHLENGAPKLTFRGQNEPSLLGELVRSTLAYYSSAAYWFDNHLLKLSP